MLFCPGHLRGLVGSTEQGHVRAAPSPSFLRCIERPGYSHHGYLICPVRVQNVLQANGQCLASGFWKPPLPTPNIGDPRCLSWCWSRPGRPHLWEHLGSSHSQPCIYPNNSAHFRKAAVSDLAFNPPPLSLTHGQGESLPPLGKGAQQARSLRLPPGSKAHSSLSP